MKTKFLKRVLWLMIPLLTIFSGNAWADYTITFKTSGTTDLINTGGAYATSAETAYVTGTSSGVQFGSGSKGGNIVLTMTASGQVKASKITLNGYCKFASKGGDCKVTITFTDNSTESHTPSATTTATPTDVTITNSTKTLKSIKLESTAKDKRFYVTGVTVVAAAASHTLSSSVSPAASGSVSLSATSVAEGSTATATATPATHYVFDHWSISGTGSTLSSTTTNPTTVTMGTANTTVTATFVAAPKASVTLSEAGATTTDATYYVGDSYTLPSTTSATCGSKVLVGWSKVEVATTDTKPTSNYYEKGASVTLGATQTFYAVFATASGGGGAEWVETTIGDLTGSDIFVLATPAGYAVSNNNGTSSAPTAISITVSEGKITSSVTDAMKWNLGGNSTDGYIFYPNGITTTWLYCNTTAASGSNNNIRVGTGDRKHWIADEDGDYVTNDTYTDRWLCNYNNADFRGYIGSSVTSDIVSKFYKYSAGTTYSAYSTSCCTPLGQINGSIKSISGTSATLKWDNLSYVDGTTPYSVTVSPSVGTTVGGISTVDGYKNCTITGLTAGTEYTFTINAFGDASHCNSSQKVVATTPKITLGSASGTSTYIEGYGPGSKQTFTVTAVGLTGNLTVTVPSNFAVCATENGSYTSSITLTPTSGAVSTTVYFQLVADKTSASSPYAGSVTVSGGSATSQTVSVNGTVSPACADPTINTQPAANATYNLNVGATALSVTATKNGTGPALTYQWYSNTANSKTTPTPTPIDGATSTSYTPPTTATGTKYYFCEVSSGACAVTTNISAITVNTPSITVSKTSIAFGDQAKDGSHTETFTVTGTNLAYNTGLTLAISGSSYFTIDKSSVAQTSAGAVSTTTITVTYAPTAIGNNHSATITISSTGAATKTVTLSGNSKYKITWVDQAASPATETYTYVASGKPTFPTDPTGGCDSYTYFYGWAEGTFTTPVTAPGTSSTIKVYKSADDMPTVSGDVTYYAVWADSPGGWSKASSVSVGDVIVITDKNDTKELTGIYMPSSTYIGKAEAFTTTPNGTFPLSVVTGYNDTGVAFKNGDDYLLGSSSNDLSSTTTLAELASWTLSYDGVNDDWSITNKNQTTRRIRYNGSASPNRFCTYTSEQTGIHIYKQSAAGNCVTNCCSEVAARSGSVSMGSTSATVSWTNVANISSWDVTCNVTGGASAGTKGSITGTTTKSVEFTGLQPNTGYTFHILGTSNDDAYCDVDDELTGTTECQTPSSLSIASTENKWDFCAGETMTLTVSGTNISGSATYQWKKHNGSTWDNISGANSASYSTTMAASTAGQYCCTVTNPGSGTCSATSGGVWVRVWQLHLGDDDIDFTYVDGTTGNNTAVYLNSDTHYEFKLKDNNGGWFGLNDKTITATISAFALNGTGANVNVTSGLEGNYTFTINYSDKNNPTIAVTYPVGNQPSGRKIWFDKSVITGWTDAGTSDLVWRIGKKANSMTNKDDPANAFTLVPGTDRFYVYETKEYNGFEAWHVANNVAWSGNSDNDPNYDNHSIYTHYHNQTSTDVKYATVYQKYVIGTSGVTLVPTTKKNTDWYCDFWNVTKYDGMLTHTATITPPSHGTIRLEYTSKSGSPSTSTVSDLPHRSYITATAIAADGYELTSFTVTPEGESASSLVATNGQTNNHILAKNATFAATFSAKTINITWNGNGGTPSKASDTWVYDAAALASLPTASGNGSKIFVGWFTDASTGTQIDNVGGSNKPTADVEYFAHWSDGNTVYFNPGAGTVSPDHATQTTVGGSVSLPTPTPTCDGWTFQGWKVGSTQTEVTELPAGLVTGSYVPESATIQMYAVYKKTFDETAPVTSTYNFDDVVTGWVSTGTWTTRTRSENKCGEVNADATYKFNSKVAVKSFSFKFRRESNNTGGTIGIEKSTDGSTWTDVGEWGSMSDASSKDTWYTFSRSGSTYFDGTTAYYVRMYFSTSGSAYRYFDDISITYNATTSVTHYATNPLECSQVATPVITPEGDSYTDARDVTITCATDGATIRYTTDGTNPSSSVGTIISSGSSFTLSCSGTVKAIAYKDGMADSDIASETYTIKVPDPTFSPDGGNFNVAQSVSLSSAFAGTTVYYEYTTDGSEPSDPTSSSTAYSSTPIPVAVGQTVRIKAIGINGCATNSDIVSKTFRVGWDFELVTDEDDLNAGDKIVILSGSTAALSTYQGSNNRTSSSDFDISGTTVTAYPASTNSSTTVQVLTLAGGAGEWRLKPDASHYLNVPSDGKLTTHSEDGNSRQWTIDIGSSPNYYATITNKEYTSCKIEYGTVFAAYSTGQNPVKIYSIANPDPLIKVEGTLSAFAGCTTEASAAQSFYVSGKNLSASIRVTAPTGYEVSLSSGSDYAGYIDVARVGTAVAKTQVYVRLKAGDAGAVAANNVVVSVSADDLSQNVAIPATTISAADTYIDRMHGAATQYGCGSYSAPTLVDFEGEGTDCQENYAIFQGWVAADQINLDGTLKAGATVVAGGASKTASGTTYYSIWEASDE